MKRNAQYLQPPSEFPSTVLVAQRQKFSRALQKGICTVLDWWIPRDPLALLQALTYQNFATVLKTALQAGRCVVKW